MERSFRVWAVTDDGRYLEMGEAILCGDVQGWGRQIPVDLSALRELRFVGQDDRTTFTASFDSSYPWE
jgi:hypothetical protein